MFAEVDQSKFPNTEGELLALSHRSYRFQGPVAAVATSLLAAERALIKNSHNELSNFFAARAAYWLIEFGGNDFDQKNLAQLGFQYAEEAETRDGSRAAYAFLLGVHLAYQVRDSAMPRLIDLRRVRDYFQRAVELDPYWDEAAPLRAMGILLIKSPSWPASVGDNEEGVALLEKAAAAYPLYPSTFIFMAEGHYDLDDYGKAMEDILLTLKLVTTTDWGVPGEAWKKQAEALRAKIEKKIKNRETGRIFLPQGPFGSLGSAPAVRAHHFSLVSAFAASPPPEPAAAFF
jgi:hypothetical protein